MAKDTYEFRPRKRKWNFELWWGIGFAIGWSGRDFGIVLPFVIISY